MVSEGDIKKVVGNGRANSFIIGILIVVQIITNINRQGGILEEQVL